MNLNEQLNEQKEKIELEIKKLENVKALLVGKFENARDSAFSRFPLVFVLLSSFGLVATFYGFEKVIDQIPFLAENPFTILVTGVGVLLITGALYKKLS